MSKIERELLQATGEKPHKDGEARQKYIGRLLRAVNALTDKAYGKLSDPLQEYLSEATEALNEKKDLPDFPGEAGDKKSDKGGKKPSRKAKASKEDDAEDEDAEEEDGEDEDAEEEEEEDDAEDEDEKPRSKRSSRKSRKAKASKEDDADEDEDAEEKAPRKQKPGKPGAVALLRKTIVLHPSWKRDQVREAVEKKGFDVKDNTLSIHYYEARSIIKLLNEHGHLTKDYAGKLG